MPSNLITHILQSKTQFCLMCFAPLKCNNLHELFFKNINICPECFAKLSPIRKKISVDGVDGELLFSYSDFMREKIYTFKGCGDIELGKAFINYFLPELKIKYKGYYLVPAPSNLDSETERGFSHVEEIFKPLKLPFIKAIRKKAKYKQSDLTRNEREKVIDKLELLDKKKVFNKKILFVDDIYTTGSTLKACINLIKKGQPKKLKFLIVAKVKNLNEN